MEEQKGITEKGGTMRLGAYKCKIVDRKSNIYKAYEKIDVRERHRHRYEFNDHYLSEFENAGMKAVGLNPDTNLVEVIEIPQHKWFVGSTVSSRIQQYSFKTASVICCFY